MRLADYLDQKLICLDLPVSSKEAAIAEMVKRMKENRVIENESYLLEEISGREAQGCTALGNGVAVPHARLKSLDKIVIAMARPVSAVPCCKENHKPVRLVFIVITPIGKVGEYLKVLAKLAKFLKEKKLLKQLLTADSSQAAWELFEAVEPQDT